MLGFSLLVAAFSFEPIQSAPAGHTNKYLVHRTGELSLRGAIRPQRSSVGIHFLVATRSLHSFCSCNFFISISRRI